MSNHPLIMAVEAPFLREDLPQIDSGDTVRVHVKVTEGNKERIQMFEGVVIRLYGSGINHRFTVRRITHGVGVERTFMMTSPKVEKVEIMKRAVVHHKNLYYMRGLTGKAARLRERRH